MLVLQYQMNCGGKKNNLTINPKNTDVGMECRVLATGKNKKKIANVFSRWGVWKKKRLITIKNYVWIHIDNFKWLVRAEHVLGLTKWWRLGLLLPFSLSQGIFSNMSLRDNNDQHLSETKEVARVQGKGVAGHSLSWSWPLP